MSDETEQRVGFRDIYRAVGESEARIVAALNAAIAPLTVSSTDHESRLRVIEAAVAPMAVLATDRDRRLVAVEGMTAGLTSNMVGANNRRAGQVAVFTTGQKVLASIGVIAMIAVNVLNFIK